MLQKRRRSLLTLASYGTWDFDLASFPYVYNSLLPNGSEVVKGKIAKIYANGVIENQLNYYGDMSSVDGYYGIDTDISDTTLAVSNSVLTITPVSNLSKIRVVSRRNIQIIANHKYLISADIKSSIQLNSVGQRVGTATIPNLGNVGANVWTKVSSILSSSVDDLNQSTWYFKSDTAIATTDSIQIKNAMCIDLTLMFGTGNEPTTLTDNRIQNLLNRGYIAYNQGEYKGTNVGEIATEPYNLFDGVLNVHSGDNYQLDATNNIDVNAGQTYSFETVNFSNYTGRYVTEYDENGTFIKTNTFYKATYPANQLVSVTMSNNTKYVRLAFYNNSSYSGNIPEDPQICFHLTGSRTGYAEHKPSASIPFIYQGNGAINAHDTFEITSSEYVFTKNIGSVDLGSLTWGKASAYGYFSSSLNSIAKKPSNNSIIPNIICSAYTTLARSNSLFFSTGNNVITIDADDDVDISTQHLSTENDFKVSVSGVYLHYELATPQVIRIPRKHLGIVDLGSLSWTYNPNGFFISAYALANVGGKLPTSSSIQANLYCSLFITATFSDTYSSKDMSIGANDVGSLIIRNNGFGTDPDQFKNAMQGVYLFYETAEEVDDIATRIFTENGGTVTTNEREEYDNLIDSNIASTTANDFTASITNGVVSITKNASGNWGNMLRLSSRGIAGHKYLFYSTEPSYSNVVISTQGSNPYIYNPNTITTQNDTPSNNFWIRIHSTTSDSDWAVGTTITFIAMLFDLTEAFGEGNEPTSIDDPRIVELSTSGMIIRKPTEVLPNLDLDLPIKV